MAEPVPHPAGSRMPRVPVHAWAWLQRSRPVLEEVARQLTGQPPTPAFLDDLRDQFSTDPFVQDVVIRVIADVAFGGRVPTRRPAGTAWDRGLVWWAALLAGVTPEEFEAGSKPPPATQRPLFDAGVGPPAPPAPAPHSSARPRPLPSPGRDAMAAALRDLLASAEGDQVPASAVRHLLAELESR